MKLKASYIAKLNKMTSKELVKLLDKVNHAAYFNFGTKVQRKKNSEKIDLLTKTIVKIIFKNYPDVAKVIAVYESVDGTTPTLDKVKFSASAGVLTNAVIGENISGKSSNAIARVVANSAGGDANSLEIVYLNSSKFSLNDKLEIE